MAKKTKFAVGEWVICVNHRMSPIRPRGDCKVDDNLTEGKLYRIYATSSDGEHQFLSVAQLTPIDSTSVYANRFKKPTPAQLKKFLKTPRRKV